MLPKSIRWRLPISYAAIALLTTLALGAVLLIVLQRTYQRQEITYLTGNAEAISRVVIPFLQDKLPLAAVESQLRNFAFLSQTRVRLLDNEEQVLLDTGPIQAEQEVLALALDVDIELDSTQQIITQTVTLADQKSNYTPFIIIQEARVNPLDQDLPLSALETLIDVSQHLNANEDEDAVRVKETFTITTSDPLQLERLLQQEFGSAQLPGLISSISTVGTPYGFELGIQPTNNTRRSQQRIRQPFYHRNGDLLGYIELSNGPAYGDQVLRSVTWGWGLASGLAIMLAVGAGWVVSQQISQPLASLTSITGQMAAGDLSIRAEITQSDTAPKNELESLATSFNEMANQVEKTVSILRRFVADAAHELHTPLTALRTNLELAAAESEQIEQLKLLDTAQAQIMRLETLTNGLLALSRLETTTQQSLSEEVDLVNLLHEASERFTSQAEQANISCLFHIPDQPLKVCGDSAQLRQVFDNLVDNALKFTPAGGSIQMGVSLEENLVVLWVQDNGLGILPEDQPHLFDRFHRGRNAANYPGNGLGLAIAKAIVDRHGGRIEIVNLQPGAKMLVRLPPVKSS